MPSEQAADVDRLELDVDVVENTRPEDIDDLEQYLTTAFFGVYDEIEIIVTHE